MKKIAIVALLLVSVAVGGAAQNMQDGMTPRENLEYLIGTWETTYEWPGMGEVREETVYTWNEDKSAVDVDLKVYNKGEQIDSGTGWIKINPETGAIYSQVNSTAMNEVYSQEEISREGAVVWMEGEGGAMMPHFRVKMEYTGQDSFDWTIYTPQEDDWNEMMAVTYTRVK